jgi:type II secretory pathway component PulM
MEYRNATLELACARRTCRHWIWFASNWRTSGTEGRVTAATTSDKGVDGRLAHQRRQAVIGAWWQKQSERDRRRARRRRTLAVLLLAWAFVWYPLARARTQLESRVEHERTDLAWMRQTSGELQVLRAKGAHGQVDRQGKSLFALADVTARVPDSPPLSSGSSRPAPRSVRASFEAANFDALIAWGRRTCGATMRCKTTDFFRRPRRGNRNGQRARRAGGAVTAR